MEYTRLPINWGGWSYAGICLLASVLYLSVDIFAMITGYLMCERKTVKLSSLVKLWKITYFYIVVVLFILKIFHLTHISGIESYIYILFPMTKGRYWYLVCYSFMFILIPYLNKLINILTKQEFRKLLTVLILMCSVFPTLFMTDFFRVNNGYCALWLIICYFIGAYVKKYRIRMNSKLRWYIVGVNTLVIALSAILIRCYWSELMKRLFTQYSEQLLFQYISPFIVINSALLVSLFSEMEFDKSNKIKLSPLVQILSEGTFGVYVLHIHILIFDNYLKNAFIGFAEQGAVKLIIQTMGTILLIFALCSLIEIIRHFITVKLGMIGKGYSFKI